MVRTILSSILRRSLRIRSSSSSSSSRFIVRSLACPLPWPLYQARSLFFEREEMLSKSWESGRLSAVSLSPSSRRARSLSFQGRGPLVCNAHEHARTTRAPRKRWSTTPSIECEYLQEVKQREIPTSPPPPPPRGAPGPEYSESIK